MVNHSQRRRSVLKLGAVALTAPTLAGCGGGGGGTATDKQTIKPPASRVGKWLDDTPNYESVVRQDSTDVTVTVGAGDDGHLFSPPAISVPRATTVTWEWSGAGGSHSVVDRDGAFESELTGEEGHTFEQTFNQSGQSFYYCETHKEDGMKGAVVVEAR